MTTDTNIHRDLGRLEAQVSSLSTQVTLMQAQLAAIHETVSTAKGGWKVLVGVGTVSATITAILGKFFGVFWR